MSDSTGGKYYYVPQTRELSATLLKISYYINSAYIINAKVNGLDGDNSGNHYISINVDIRDSVGSMSKYFFATNKLKNIKKETTSITSNKDKLYSKEFYHLVMRYIRKLRK